MKPAVCVTHELALILVSGGYDIKIAGPRNKNTRQNTVFNLELSKFHFQVIDITAGNDN